MNGIFIINKEKGYTSHDVVAIMRRILNMKKVGHCGTLDPEAEGVLVVLAGVATKLSKYIINDSKRYTTEINLGVETNTQDHTGEIVKKTTPDVKLNEIEDVIKSFIGVNMQIPPMFSAIKVNGQRLYKIARAGKEIERDPRRIMFYNIELLEYNPPDKIIIDVECSKGAYIRTLCHDIGRALGCGGHMSSLIRTKSGDFRLENSCTLSRIKEMSEGNTLDEAAISIEEVLSKYNKAIVYEEFNKLLLNGNKLNSDQYSINKKLSDSMTVVYDHLNNLTGIYNEKTEDGETYLIPEKMLFV